MAIHDGLHRPTRLVLGLVAIGAASRLVGAVESYRLVWLHFCIGREWCDSGGATGRLGSVQRVVRPVSLARFGRRLEMASWLDTFPESGFGPQRLLEQHADAGAAGALRELASGGGDRVDFQGVERGETGT
jgi:hypothetical protein